MIFITRKGNKKKVKVTYKQINPLNHVDKIVIVKSDNNKTY